MDRLKETNRYTIFKPEEGNLPKTLENLPKYLRKLVIWLEQFYKDVASRTNWLMTNTVEAHTASDTLTEHESGSVHTNLGATGTITLTLPTLAKSGIKFAFAVQAAKELRIDPATATIRDDSGQTIGKYKTCSTVGASLMLITNSTGDWVTIAKNGAWTEEV